jgi:antitoxin HicB
MRRARNTIRRTVRVPRRRNGKSIPVGQYTVILSPEPEGGFTVTVPALPGCVTHGDDLVSARRNAREAIECHLGSLLKHGERIPVDETISTSVLVGKA